MILLLAIGLLIGAVLGLTGAGGSLLAMPLLMLALHSDPTTATGLALGVVAASSMYGAIRRIRHHEILWIPVLLFGASGMVLAPVGRWLASQTSATMLVSGFSILSVLIAARMMWQSIRQPEQASVVRAGSSDESTSEALLCRFSETTRFDWRLRCTIGLLVGGILTGILSGFFGVGGGFLIVPFLNQLNGVSMRHAVATSLVIIAGISASGFVAHLLTATIDWQQLMLLAVGGISGMVVGHILASRIAGVHLQRIFAITIVVMAIVMTVKS